MTSGVAEFWSLTIDERKRLLEAVIEEAREANPDVIVQPCPAAMSAKDCVDLTQHAQQAGASGRPSWAPPDICSKLRSDRCSRSTGI